MLNDDQIGRIFAGESPIRVLREHRGLTIPELARMAGVEADQLECYEEGHARPGSDRLTVIAEVLDADPIALRRCDEHFAALRQFAACAEERLPEDA